MQKRLMGLDYGERTVGVAVSDLMGWTAQGIETVRRKEDNNLKATVARLREIIKEYGVKKIVLGYPKNMNNTIGPRAERTEQFKKRIEKEFGLEVELWDERMSTMAARRGLLEADISRKKQKKVIDKMAAVYILQGYLDAHPNL